MSQPSSYAEAASAQNQEEERQINKNGELWLQRRLKVAGAWGPWMDVRKISEEPEESEDARYFREKEAERKREESRIEREEIAKEQAGLLFGSGEDEDVTEVSRSKEFEKEDGYYTLITYSDGTTEEEFLRPFEEQDEDYSDEEVDLSKLVPAGVDSSEDTFREETVWGVQGNTIEGGDPNLTYDITYEINDRTNERVVVGRNVAQDASGLRRQEERDVYNNFLEQALAGELDVESLQEAVNGGVIAGQEQARFLNANQTAKDRVTFKGWETQEEFDLADGLSREEWDQQKLEEKREAERIEGERIFREEGYEAYQAYNINLETTPEERAQPIIDYFKENIHSKFIDQAGASINTLLQEDPEAGRIVQKWLEGPEAATLQKLTADEERIALNEARRKEEEAGRKSIEEQVDSTELEFAMPESLSEQERAEILAEGQRIFDEEGYDAWFKWQESVKEEFIVPTELPEVDDEYSEEALFAEVQAKINEGKIPEGAKVAFEEGGMDEFFKWVDQNTEGYEEGEGEAIFKEGGLEGWFEWADKQQEEVDEEYQPSMEEGQAPKTPVVDASGEEMFPTGDDATDINGYMSELTALIEGSTIESIDDLNALVANIDGLGEEFGVEMESLANLEGAAQIIDKYMDEILDQALSYTLDMFGDEDSSEFFGRKSRSGIEETIERVYTQLDVELSERKEKVTNLVNLRYDQAAERLARAGLIDAGGITGSGTYMARLEQLETERAASIIEKELEADDWVRGELKEAATMLENLKTSLAAEEQTRQKTRLDTTKQLLDFVTTLEEVRLSERQVSVQEGALDLDKYNAAVDEKIRIAEQTGMLDGEETVVLREIYSRMELENRKLDLEAIWFDEEMDFNSRVQAFREVVDIKRIGLEARKMNLEETLGLAGLQLEERRLKLDQYLGEAGVALEERGLIIDMMLGEGDLNIRRDQLGIERDRLNSQSFIEKQKLLIDQQRVDLDEKDIDNRYALEEQRLEFDYFVEGNRTTLTLNDQKIQQERNDISRLNLDIESERLQYEERRDILDRSLGFARLTQEGEALALEDRKFIFDQMLQQRKLSIEEQRLAFEEVMFNDEMDLADRRLYLEGTIAKSNLDDADKDRAVDWFIANAKVRQDDRSLDLQERDISNREQERFINATGMYIDPNGDVQMTWKSKMQEEANRLTEMGLTTDANRLKHDMRVFDDYTSQLLVLEQNQYEQSRHEFERRMKLESERLGHDIKVALEANEIDRIVAATQSEDVKNRADYNEKKLEYDRQHLQNQIREQALDRQQDMTKFNAQLDFEELKFSDWKDRDDREWQFQIEQSAQQYGLDVRELELIEFKAQHDAAMGNDDFESAAYAYAEQWGLPPNQVVEALNVARENRARVMDQYAMDRGLSEEQLRQLKQVNDAFEETEVERDELWAMVDNDEFDWSNVDDRAEFTALLNLANGTSTTFTGYDQDEGGGAIDYFGDLFGQVLIAALTGKNALDIDELKDLLPDLPWRDDDDDEKKSDGSTVVKDAVTDKVVDESSDRAGNRIKKIVTENTEEVVVVSSVGGGTATGATTTASASQAGAANAVVASSTTGGGFTPLAGAQGAGFLGAGAVVLGSIAAVYKGYKFFGGSQSDAWNAKGYQLPSIVSFDSKLYYEGSGQAGSILNLPTGHLSSSVMRKGTLNFENSLRTSELAPPDIVTNTNSSTLMMFIDWEDRVVRWSDKRSAGVRGSQILKSEPVDEFIERTGQIPMTGKQLRTMPSDPNDPDSPPLYDNWKDLAKDVGLDDWKEKNTRVIWRTDGLLFTGTKVSGNMLKNSKLVKWEDIGSARYWTNPEEYPEIFGYEGDEPQPDITPVIPDNNNDGEPDWDPAREARSEAEEKNEITFDEFPPMPEDMPKMSDFTTEENRIYTQALQASTKTDSSIHMDAYQAVMEHREKKKKEASDKGKSAWERDMDTTHTSGSDDDGEREPFTRHQQHRG